MSVSPMHLNVKDIVILSLCGRGSQMQATTLFSEKYVTVLVFVEKIWILVGSSQATYLDTGINFWSTFFMYKELDKFLKPGLEEVPAENETLNICSSSTLHWMCEICVSFFSWFARDGHSATYQTDLICCSKNFTKQ